MATPKLITYASDFKTIEIAIKSGITHLILEDPRFSSKCFRKKKNSIKELTSFARNFKNDIELSTTIDLLARPDDFSEIKLFLSELKESDIKKIRMQDLGIIKFIKEHYFEADLIFTHETANLNFESIKYISNFAKAQTLSPLLSLKDLKTIVKKVNSKFEYLIHGDLFIHYSDKHFCSEFMLEKNLNANPTYIEDTDNPSCYFPIKETQKTFFILNYFQKSLINYLSELKELNLDGLIIDLRSEKNLLKIKKILDLYYEGLINKQKINTNLINFPNSVLRQGFFHSNLFDLRKTNTYLEVKRKSLYLGQVLDTLEKKWLVVDAIKPFKVNMHLQIIDPEEKIYNFEITVMKNLKMEPVMTSKAGEIVMIKIPGKNIPPKSIVLLQNKKD